MRVRFQADNDLRHYIATGVQRRNPEIDFQTALAAGLDAMPDEDVLALCAKQGRILVSHDVTTMPRHFASFVQSHHCPGVFLISQSLPAKEAIDALMLIWEVSKPEDWHNQLCWIPSLATLDVGFPTLRPSP
ncbi:hypothetical protein F183_A46960 [Bryobacterales bacterium F-183]|nr:hypothetical protein F183_A46960 [Bryobacterales bacterium F-183]